MSNFRPVCSSECGKSDRHRHECSILSACARFVRHWKWQLWWYTSQPSRTSEEELLPVKHLLALRLLLTYKKDEFSWQKLEKMEDHHGVQTFVRSAEAELLDANRRDLRQFIREKCGLGPLAIPDDHLDLVDDLIKNSSVSVNCGAEFEALRLENCRYNVIISENQGLSHEFPAFYLNAGLMSHSCLPNARLMFDREHDFQVILCSKFWVSSHACMSRHHRWQCFPPERSVEVRASPGLM